MDKYRRLWSVIVAVSGLGLASAAVMIGAGYQTSNDALTATGWWVFGCSIGLVAMYGVVLPALFAVATGARDALLRRGQVATKGLEILEAEYGGVSATSALRYLVANDRLDVQVMPTPLGLEDPQPNVVKTLSVRYRFGGREHTISRKDGEQLTIPKPV